MNHTIRTAEDPGLPWYRQLWPWLIMIPPAGAVVGGFVTLYLAGAIPAMVVEDYGRIDEISEQVLDMDRRAAELGLVARLEIDAASGGAHAVAVSFESAGWLQPPGLIVVKLFHPALPGHDRQAFLAGSAGSYRGEMEWLPGRYYLEIGDADGTWRLAGELTEDTRDVVLRAAGLPGQFNRRGRGNE